MGMLNRQPIQTPRGSAADERLYVAMMRSADSLSASDGAWLCEPIYCEIPKSTDEPVFEPKLGPTPD